MKEVDWAWCYENPRLAAAEIMKLHATLELARTYIEGEPVANAVVVPAGEAPKGSHPSLIETIDGALNSQL